MNQDPSATPDTNAREATHQRVNEALDKANAKLRELRDEGQPTVETRAAQAREFGAQGKAAATDASAHAREKLAGAASQTSAYVAEKPLQSLASAAAAGAALALLLGRRRD